jgi:hypothetical protein
MKDEKETLKIKFDKDTLKVMQEIKESLQKVEKLLKENSRLIVDILDRPFDLT